MNGNQGKRNGGWCRASDLAEMGVCERRIWLAVRYGKLSTPEQDRARARGVGHHQVFHRGALSGIEAAPSTSEPKRWCFIATVVYGENAAETQLLRRFRDVCMRPCRTGRWFVKLYYRFSPALARAVADKPRLRMACAVALRPLVAIAGLALRLFERDQLESTEP